jgi:hypothetical protein
MDFDKLSNLQKEISLMRVSDSLLKNDKMEYETKF